MKLQIASQLCARHKAPLKKLETPALTEEEKQRDIQKKLEHTLGSVPRAGSIEEFWSHFRKATINAASQSIGLSKRRNQDWFDENDVDISTILDELHETHPIYLANRRDANRKADVDMSVKNAFVRC